jgi:tyrosine-protein kinase Etk/Wzc
LNGLQRQAGVAEDAFLAVVGELEELEIASHVDTSGVRVALQAMVPSRPVSPNKLANVVIGGGLGMILGLLVAAWRQYVRPKGFPSVPDA